MAVSRSNLLGSPIWFIYTFYTAKGSINTKYQSPMYSILDTIRKSNIKISTPHNSKEAALFSKKYFFVNHRLITNEHQISSSKVLGDYLYSLGCLSVCLYVCMSPPPHTRPLTLEP